MNEVILVLDGGAETTRTVIGSIIRELALDTASRQRLIDHPELLQGPAVEEFIRWVSPISNMRRTATVDDELHGQQIRKGDELLLLYGAANRDPSACHGGPRRRRGAGLAARPRERQNLVDLLLVLGDDHRHLGVVEHVGKLAGNRVLVERHGHAAQRLRRELCPVEAGAVVAEHGQLVAALEARRCQPEREIAHVARSIRARSRTARCRGPSRACRSAGELLHVAAQELRQRVGGWALGERSCRAPLLVPR